MFKFDLGIKRLGRKQTEVKHAIRVLVVPGSGVPHGHFKHGNNHALRIHHALLICW